MPSEVRPSAAAVKRRERLCLGLWVLAVWGTLSLMLFWPGNGGLLALPVLLWILAALMRKSARGEVPADRGGPRSWVPDSPFAFAGVLGIAGWLHAGTLFVWWWPHDVSGAMEGLLIATQAAGLGVVIVTLLAFGLRRGREATGSHRALALFGFSLVLLILVRLVPMALTP